MFVGQRMTRDVITVGRTETLRRASHLLRQGRIHQLPVVEGGDLVGFVSGTDIRNATMEGAALSASGEIVAENKTVEAIMTREVVTASPSDTVEDALVAMLRRRLSALPVVVGKRLVGIITKSDVLAAFADALRVEEVGVRIEVALPDGIRSGLRLVRELGEMKAEVRSLLLSPSGDGLVALVRLRTIDLGSVKKALKGEGFDVLEGPLFPD